MRKATHSAVFFQSRTSRQKCQTPSMTCWTWLQARYQDKNKSICKQLLQRTLSFSMLRRNKTESHMTFMCTSVSHMMSRCTSGDKRSVLTLSNSEVKLYMQVFLHFSSLIIHMEGHSLYTSFSSLVTINSICSTFPFHTAKQTQYTAP